MPTCSSASLPPSPASGACAASAGPPLPPSLGRRVASLAAPLASHSGSVRKKILIWKKNFYHSDIFLSCEKKNYISDIFFSCEKKV